MRQGGNPNLKKYSYSVKGSKPLDALLSVNVESELLEAIKSSSKDSKWQDSFREMLRSLYLKNNSSQRENFPSLESKT
ncbi:hypothetical protein QUA70_19770 [Microcoleus sp. LAD1_D5]|uniref:hypothetical protein n=1 Tax=Microcoleus sp. LAD1_D5 TaxID=2818813 RepID=UPI002FD14F2B